MKFWSILWYIITIAEEYKILKLFDSVSSWFEITWFATSEALRLHVFVSSSLLWRLYLKAEHCSFAEGFVEGFAQVWLGKAEKNWTKQSEFCNLTWKTTTRSTFYMAIIIKYKNIRIVNTA